MSGASGSGGFILGRTRYMCDRAYPEMKGRSPRYPTVQLGDCAKKTSCQGTKARHDKSVPLELPRRTLSSRSQSAAARSPRVSESHHRLFSVPLSVCMLAVWP